eukprot:scaffold22696_cov63-Isochrysis_galbana.AAC.1
MARRPSTCNGAHEGGAGLGEEPARCARASAAGGGKEKGGGGSRGDGAAARCSAQRRVRQGSAASQGARAAQDTCGGPCEHREGGGAQVVVLLVERGQDEVGQPRVLHVLVQGGRQGLYGCVCVCVFRGARGGGARLPRRKEKGGRQAEGEGRPRWRRAGRGAGVGGKGGSTRPISSARPGGRLRASTEWSIGKRRVM